MNEFYAAMFLSHLLLALILFFAVNWIGKHAIDFGYTSMTLFEMPSESLALNFFLRALSPAVFIILISAIAVAIHRPEWRLGVYLIAIYYYLFRFVAIFFFNMQRLVNWLKFAVHIAVGVTFAMIAYHYLIIPNRSLLPNLEEAGNELWLALIGFLYAVTNKVSSSPGPGAHRRNQFVKFSYMQAVQKFGPTIDGIIHDERLKLIVYSVLIYENYARPAAIRVIERLLIWKRSRTTGIMQVSADVSLSDLESVVRGANRLADSWTKHGSQRHLFQRAWQTIGEYNTDTDYIRRVFEVMEILAKRIDVGFRPVYDEMHTMTIVDEFLT